MEILKEEEKLVALITMTALVSCYFLHLISAICAFLIAEDDFSFLLLANAIVSFILTLQNHFVLNRVAFPFLVLEASLATHAECLVPVCHRLLCSKKCCSKKCQAPLQNYFVKQFFLFGNVVYFFLSLACYNLMFIQGSHGEGVIVFLTFAFHFSLFFMKYHPKHPRKAIVIVVAMGAPLVLAMLIQIPFFIKSRI